MIDNSVIDTLSPLPVLAKLRYWHHSDVDRYDDDTYHQHNFWQVDIAQKGSAVMQMDGENYKIVSGCFIIIPPGVIHTYHYKGIYRNWSFKFRVENYNKGLLRPCVLQKNEVTDSVYHMIDTIMSKYTKGFGEFALPAHFKDVALVEYQLAGIIAWLSDQQPQNSILDEIRKLINENHGIHVKVSDIAVRVNYSREHLNIIVKNISGISVKRFIDEERSLIAKRFIKYSDMNLSEISDYMGFPDVFGFSKFFSRMNGVSPSKWRIDNSS